MTSFGTMLTRKWNSGTLAWPGACYRVMCRCGDPECGLTMDFDYHDGIFQIHFYTKMYWPYWKGDNWFQKMWLRIKASLKILFTGYMDCENDMTIIEEEHFQGIIDALEEAKIKMREHEAELAKNWVEILADKAIKNLDDNSKK